MRIVCCPDSLKGVLSAREAARALAAGVRRVPGLEADELPLADGGEGTAEALAGALEGEWRVARASDALGRPVEARFLLLPDGPAVVEAAEAIGLLRLEPGERDPMRATSYGLGELLLAALDAGAQEVIVTLGGSATVDGGDGLRAALAARSLHGVRLRAACDVTNPLLGERGAARVFGPQKGATPAQVAELERRLAAMEELRPFADLPGAGAAGGLGAALAALGATLERGAELVLDAVGFRERIAGASLVITGEGTVDETSSQGKVPGAAAAVCAGVSVPCAVFGGVLRGGIPELYELGATAVFPLSGEPERAVDDLAGLGEALGRLLVAPKLLSESVSESAEAEAMIDVRPLTEEDRPWAVQVEADSWGEPVVARLGELVDPTRLPGFIAFLDGQRAGLVSYAMRGDECEVVTIRSLREGYGIGRALFDAVHNAAIEAGCRRLWLVTTNNNVRALALYQRRGMDIVALHRHAVSDARHSIKPSIPERDAKGISIAHELELELRLEPRRPSAS